MGEEKMTLDEFLKIDWDSESFIKAVQILKAALNSDFICKYTTLSLERIQVYDETEPNSSIINLSLKESEDRFSQILRLVIKNEKITIYNKLAEDPIKGCDEITFDEVMNIFQQRGINSAITFF